MSRSLAYWGALALLLGAPAAAQDAGYGPVDDRAVSAEEAMANASQYWTPTPPRERPSECDEANPDPDTIVVCREWEDGEEYQIERDRSMVGADVRDTAGGAPLAPNFDESCLHTRGRANCMMLGRTPPPAIMVDFSTLPETPADSEAARLYGGPTTDDAIAENAEPSP